MRFRERERGTISWFLTDVVTAVLTCATILKAFVTFSIICLVIKANTAYGKVNYKTISVKRRVQKPLLLFSIMISNCLETSKLATGKHHNDSKKIADRSPSPSPSLSLPARIQEHPREGARESENYLKYFLLATGTVAVVSRQATCPTHKHKRGSRGAVVGSKIESPARANFPGARRRGEELGGTHAPVTARGYPSDCSSFFLLCFLGVEDGRSRTDGRIGLSRTGSVNGCSQTELS